MADNLYIKLNKNFGKDSEYRWQIGERYDEGKQGNKIKSGDKGVYPLIINFLTREYKNGREIESSRSKLTEKTDSNVEEKLKRIYFMNMDKKDIEKVLSHPHLHSNEKLKNKMYQIFLEYANKV